MLLLHVDPGRGQGDLDEIRLMSGRLAALPRLPQGAGSVIFDEAQLSRVSDSLGR